MIPFRSARRVCAVAITGLLISSFAGASPLTVPVSQGSLAAKAVFDVSGTDLIVTLTNTSSSDVMAPADVLTALFFDSATPLTLARTSATLSIGSVVHFGSTDPGGVVGGEWAYGSGLAGAPHGSAYGISSTGVNLFGPGDRFPGNDLQPPASPDGVQYGITSTGDNVANGNATVTGANALIQNEVVFVLSGLPANFDPSTQISNVNFQYGTDLSEPNIPEPGTLGLLAVGVLGMLRRR